MRFSHSAARAALCALILAIGGCFYDTGDDPAPSGLGDACETDAECGSQIAFMCTGPMAAAMDPSYEGYCTYLCDATTTCDLYGETGFSCCTCPEIVIEGQTITDLAFCATEADAAMVTMFLGCDCGAGDADTDADTDADSDADASADPDGGA
jgi:hypothetical protein